MFSCKLHPNLTDEMWTQVWKKLGSEINKCYCYLNKGECNLNQLKHDFFVERVAKNNSWNNGDHHKIHDIFLINLFCFRYNSSLKNSTLFGNDSN